MPEQIARGSYLVNMSCIGCHSAVGADAYGKYVATYGGCPRLPRAGHDRRGGLLARSGRAQPAPAGQRTDAGEFAEMMRSGVKPDGHPFPEAMPWQNAGKMTDDDPAARYAYLTAPVP